MGDRLVPDRTGCDCANALTSGFCSLRHATQTERRRMLVWTSVPARSPPGVTCSGLSGEQLARGRDPAASGPVISLRAIRPAAARMPACRMPPPSALRKLRARSHMFSRLLTSMEPTGAPKPFRKAKHNRGKAAGQPVHWEVSSAVAALKDPRPVEVGGQAGISAAPAQISCATSSGMTVPPARLWVFSREIRPVLRAVMHYRREITLRISSTRSGGRDPPRRYATGSRKRRRPLTSPSRPNGRATHKSTSWPCSVWSAHCDLVPHGAGRHKQGQLRGRRFPPRGLPGD